MVRIPTAKGDLVVTCSIPLCLLILASVLHAQEADSQDPRELRTRAAGLYQKGKAKEAMELFSRAVELDPTSTDALLERAVYHGFLGERSEAFADYQRVVDLDDRYFLAPLHRGRLYLALGDATHAILDFDRTLTLDPRLTRAYFWLGSAYELKGESAEAEKCFRVVADFDGSDPVGLSCAGESLRWLGDVPGAEAAWRRALALEPGFEYALYFRAKHRFDSKQLEEAREDLLAARPGHEDIGDVLALRYHVLWGLEKREEWPPVLKEARKWDLSGVFRDRDAALSAETRKDPGRVVEQLTEILRREPRFLEARYLRGVYRRQTQDEDGALADLDTVLGFAPHNTQVLMERAGLHRDMGAQERALDDLDEVMRANPRHALCAWQRARARFVLGDAKGAAADIEVAMALYHRSADLWELRGRVRTHLGDYLHAIDDFYEALKLKPGSWEAFAGRGLVQEARGRDDLAVKDLEKALELAPESWEGRAEVQAHLDAAQKRLPAK